ncbi:hypothetical protein LIER_03295 [Lithospermum erythrorhizon]|uniref:Uncharacterized protein n=1 Tax=Lithospermum erythrorhizon TaxID=34254 RepID=A0AAV3NSN2_LITER
MMLDEGSSVDILFLDAYLKLGVTRAQIRPVATLLVAFTRDAVSPLGVSNLMATMGNHPQQTMKMVEFTIGDMADGAYNGIIGEPGRGAHVLHDFSQTDESPGGGKEWSTLGAGHFHLGTTRGESEKGEAT